MSDQPKKARNPWFWIPTLYYAEGIPYIAVMTISVIMYKKLGISNTDIALYTSWLYLPWVIKPLWSPVVDMFKTKRFWIVAMLFMIGVGFAGVALTVPTSGFFQYTLLFFWLLAFNSATHDIAADGFYMLGLDEGQQSWFVGIRSTFYRLAMITGQGLIVIFAGMLETSTGSSQTAWSIAFATLAGMFVLLAVYHQLFLPRPSIDKAIESEGRGFLKEFFRIFALFFKKKQIGVILGVLLLYRFAEAQLVKMVSPFLLDPRDIGGLGLSTEEVGIVYGTVGIIALTVGGILGGMFASKVGLKKAIWIMLFVIHTPDLAFVYLSQVQPENFFVINAMVALEQFGYGFGFTAYMLYMIYIADGEHKTAHFAIATGFMALGMMVPGMFSGWLQELIGYKWFFIWVIIATLPSFFIVAYAKIDPEFGKKKAEA